MSIVIWVSAWESPSDRYLRVPRQTLVRAPVLVGSGLALRGHGSFTASCRKPCAPEAGSATRWDVALVYNPLQPGDGVPPKGGCDG